MPPLPPIVRRGEPLRAGHQNKVRECLKALGVRVAWPLKVIPSGSGETITADVIDLEIAYGYLPSGTFPVATGTLPNRTAVSAIVTMLKFASNGKNLVAAGRTERAWSLWRQAPPAGANIVMEFHRINGILWLKQWDCS
jgi:hypothetical protein